MPQHKSCKKRMRTSEEERLRNRAFRSQLRTVMKEVRTEQNKDEAAKKLREAIIVIDKAASYGLIHKRNADRNKSRLTLHVNRLG
jgi:small subunit ribosomal protein S20